MDLTQVVDALQSQTSIAYGAYHNPTSITDPLNYETKYFYEDSNFPALPTRVEYPLSFDGGVTFVSTTYVYYAPNNPEGQPAGRMKFEIDPLGSTTYYTYYSTGQVAGVTTAYGTANALTTSYVYDSIGNLESVTAETGVVTHYEYNAARHLLRTVQNYDPQRSQNEDGKYNIVTEYRYDVRGNQIAMIDTYGVITRTYYDMANRPTAVVQNLYINGTLADIDLPLTSVPPYTLTFPNRNIRTDTEYDDAGNVIATTDPAGIVTRTYYDQANRPSLTIQNFVGTGVYNPASPDQNIRTEYFHDANGNVIATKDTLGIITRTYYDELNHPKTVVQNLAGQDISLATPPGRGSSSNIRTDTYYDANGNVILTVDPKNVITRTYYDALNRPTSVVQNFAGTVNDALASLQPPPAGEENNIRTDMYYDQAGRAIATVDPRGVVTRTYYDSANRPFVTVQNWIGSDIYDNTIPPRNSGAADENVRTDIAYDSFGRRDTITDPLERVTKYQYNEVGQLVMVTANYVNGGLPQNDLNQRNIVTQYAYDALGRQVQTTDTLGRVSTTTYDDLGRVSTSTQNHDPSYSQNYKDAQGNQYNLVTTFTYDVRGNQIAVIDTTGVITRTYYDALARPVSVVRNLVGQDIAIPFPPARANPPSVTANIRTDTIYLGSGSIDYILDGTGQKNDYEYDALGRLITTLDSLLHATSYEYDANGNRTLMTDAEGISTKYEYDELNRLKAVIENYRVVVLPDVETNVRTEYTYDANGNRLSIRDGNSFLEEVDYRTTFTYDALGRLKTETDPLGHGSTYGYDKLGNRVSLLDANNKTTLFLPDELNRLHGIDYPAPDADVTYTYDALGRRVSMTDGLGITTWNYTNLDQPDLITDPFGTGITYDYDMNGNRTSLSYGSQSYTYHYNDLNQLDIVAGSGLPMPVTYEYDAAGRLKIVSRPNGVNTAYNYLDNGWLQNIAHSTGVETLAAYQYQYYADGNRSQAVENILQPESEYTLTVIISGNGSVTRSSEGPYHLNDVVTLTATADPGWTFTGWSECPGTDPCSVTMNGDKTVTATFVQNEYTLTVNVAGGGIVTRDNNGPYHLNDVVTLTAVADPGWTFTGWSECPGTGSCTVTMTGNKTVTATFVQNQYALTVNVAGNGTVTRDNNGPYHLNDVVTLTAVPDPNWTFTYWSGGASGTANPVTVTITGNLTVTANFDAAPVDTGWINPAANAAVTSGAGDNNGFEITPTNAYSNDTAYAMDKKSGTNTNTACSNSGKDRHVFYDYDLSAIPTGSTILGIEVRLDMKVDATTGAPKSCIELSWDGGATWTTAKTSTTFTTSEVTYVLGGAGDTWGRTWTTDELSNFRVRITNVAANTSRNFSLDWIPVRVSYIPSSLPAGTIFADGFESGDFSRWDWATTDGDLTVSTQAAATGTHGMKVAVNDTASLMVLDGSPINQKHYSARFYFNPNSIDIPNGRGFYLFTGADNAGWVFCVYLRRVGQSYWLNLYGKEDAGSWLPESDGVYINNAWTVVEIEWQAASAPGANNGFLSLWLNDTLVETMQNIDNDTKFIKEVVMGVVDSPAAGTSGTLYFDAFESRTGNHIGLDPNGPALDPLPLPPDAIFADGFESGDLSAWYWTDTDGGSLSASTQSAAVGNYGMQAVITDTGGMAVNQGTIINVLDASDPFYFNPNSINTPPGLENLLNGASPMLVYDNMPSHEKHYTARFYFDPNSVDLPNGQGMYLFAGADEYWVLCLYVERQGTYYRLLLCGEDDALNWIENQHVYITDDWQAIEIEWQAASAPGANNGYMKLFVNDVLVDDIQNLDNDARSIAGLEFGVEGIATGTTGTVYFDAFDSHRSTHIGLDPNGPAVQPPLSDLVFLDGFESGDLSSWDDAAYGGGRLSASASAAMFGSFGMQTVITDTTPLYVEDWSPQGETQYSARFYFHPNSLVMTSGNSHRIFEGGDFTFSNIFGVMLNSSGGSYRLQMRTKNDAGTYTLSGFHVISNDWHAVEVEWQAASAPGANDGLMKLWIDNTLVDTLSGVDNDTLAIDNAYLGAVNSLDSGTSGTMYFDGFESRRGGHIGPLAYAAPAFELASANGFEQTVSYHAKVVSPSLLLQQQSTPVTIDYVYDPLKRLKEANYSNGDYYHYTYDAVGNVLQYTASQGGSTIITTYEYNDANQLMTAHADNSPVIWQYVYDPNGRLTEVLPDGTPATGAKRYTYNTAGYLIRVEAHDSSGYQLQAEMFYNGMGQRLSMTAYALGTSVTTNYTVDLTQNGRPLSATSGGNTTVYLYGLDPVAEFTTSWSYSLSDGTDTPRQLADEAGEITLSGRYTPWGDSLEYTGTGNFTFGYFGGLMDAATGLLYVGNGQYYDPATGRFLTRQAQPGKTNPYVPWGDPSGALLSPLALAVLIYGRKRKKTKLDYLVMAMIIVFGAGVGLAACAPAPGMPVGISQPPAVPPTSASTPNVPTSMPTNYTPIITIIPGSTNTPIPTSTPQSPSPDIAYALANWANDLTPSHDLGCTIFLTHILQAGGLTDFSAENTETAMDYLDARFKRIDFKSYEITHDNTGVVLRNEPKWEEKVSDPRIRPGDVVFYTKSEGGIVQKFPDHAAFIVSVGLSETTMFTTVTTGNPKPRIVEQDGLLNSSGSPCLKENNLVACGVTNQAGRSIDDTPTTMFQVTIFLRNFPK